MVKFRIIFTTTKMGAYWPYSVCRFPFTSIRLGGSLVVRLQGSNALLLEAVSGDLILGANLRADGGAANLEDGGVSVLGGFSESIPVNLPVMARERLHTLHPLGMGRLTEGMDPENRKTMAKHRSLLYLAEAQVVLPVPKGPEPGVEPLP